MLVFTLLCVLLSVYQLNGRVLIQPKALTVNCQSLGNGDEFKQRMKWRKNAEDQTTILLFKGEQLNIHFELESDADLDVLGVRYSNDGDWDLISINLDGREIGQFKTKPWHGWGHLWNAFESSGPVGGPHRLTAGKHDFSLKILDADSYGIEIDYIRLNVDGSKMEKMQQDDFLCVHKPVNEDED